MSRDLRGFLLKLQDSGLLRRVKRRVSSQYEIAALLKNTKGEMPLCFEQVDDYNCPLVAGIGGTRELMALSVGVSPCALPEALAMAIAAPLPVETVVSAPVQEHVIKAPFNLDEHFPVLRYNQLDPAGFLVSGVMVAKSVSGEKFYTSIRRMQYLGKNRSCLLVTSYEMRKQISRYEEIKEPMPVAFMFGVSPAVVLASQISTHYYNADKFAVTGALLGENSRTVKCRTVDLAVLADAEMILEGNLYPWRREKEGPFGELGGYYGEVSEQPVVEFSALTFRDNPIAQTILAGSCEEKLPEAIAREVALLAAVSQTVPCVKKVNVTMAGAGRFHAIIQLDKQTGADGKQALLSAFSADKDLKHAVAVDMDVDIFSPEDVEWAIATRVQADQDVFIISGAMGSPLDPSHLLRGVSAKMGIDATVPIGGRGYARTHIPGEENTNIEDYIS
ncbi:MAG: UbiD family decarboxylase [Acidaminococcales bacterium]|jgi:UbiD family decarboxylase|nr:UbiD family decarboxylase [Acidaminococcales bacterium]